MQLLQDIFIIENLQVINEGNSSGPTKIRGVFGRCNEKNNNGRIYPTNVFEAQLGKVQPLIEERRLCGELDHPQNDTVKLSNASHLITKLEMKGNELIGEAEILKTPAGLTAKALIEGGVKIGISSRGMGTLSENAAGDKIVNEDFRLVTFDLVADPSTRGAFPGLSESTESKFVQTSQNKLQKEGNLVTMIESRFKDAYSPFIMETTSKKKDKVQEEVVEEEVVEEKQDLMDFVRADGHYHRFAAMIVEGFADTLDKETARSDSDKKTQSSSDSGSVLGNMRARSHAKKMEIAKSKGLAAGRKIQAKGDVKAAKIRAVGAKKAGAAAERAGQVEVHKTNIAKQKLDARVKKHGTTSAGAVAAKSALRSAKKVAGAYGTAKEKVRKNALKDAQRARSRKNIADYDEKKRKREIQNDPNKGKISRDEFGAGLPKHFVNSKNEQSLYSAYFLLGEALAKRKAPKRTNIRAKMTAGLLAAGLAVGAVGGSGKASSGGSAGSPDGGKPTIKKVEKKAKNTPASMGNGRVTPDNAL